jgi:hypothetical protein
MINFIKSVSDADQDRLDKIQACINLNKAMVHHDFEYMDSVMKYVDKSLTERNDMIQDFVKRAILNCFTKISMTKTAEVKKNINFSNIFSLPKKRNMKISTLMHMITNLFFQWIITKIDILKIPKFFKKTLKNYSYYHNISQLR